MAEQAEPQQTVVKVEQIERSPQGKVRRWVAELALADEEESKWRKEGGEVYDLYDAEKSDKSFNILWSNTETLLPAVYNSTPEPDVRRRFRDADPVGKVASTALERALSYQVDDYDFDAEIEDAVLDVLLPGRGLARIVYEPHFAQIAGQGAQPASAAGVYQEPAQDVPQEQGEAQEGATQEPYERIVDQDARCEHVQWDKFRRGPGKRWKDVPWVSFEHEFTYDMAVEKFGQETADLLNYEDAADSSIVKGGGQTGKETRALFKTCKVQEIWDKEQRRVLFIAPSLKSKPALELPDPLRLRQFFPVPRPMYAIASSRSLVPKPLYRMYKKQAQELEKLSARVNKIVMALKVRGLYASHIKEAADLLDGDDNRMSPIENPALIAENGGLDKLVWILPVDVLARTLEYLYKARDQTKQAIYEISGIADIIRGATDPNETLGAQQLKSQWGSLRIQKIQRDIQRFIRDLLRLKAEVIADQFTADQLAQMTNIQLPDANAKQQAQAAIQQASMAQQPPPEQAQQVLSRPTWDDVIALMRSDAMRQYRVDIETDSTVSETINKDMQGLAEVLAQVSNIIGAVAKGLPMDVAKNVALAVVRRARMGSAVEDAIEAMQQPPPPQAEQAPPDHSLEIAQVDAQNKQAIAQAQEQSRQAIAQMQEQTKVQIAQLQQQGEAQRSQIVEQINAGREQQKMELDAAVKVLVAQISAQKTVDAATAANAQREFEQDVTA